MNQYRRFTMTKSTVGVAISWMTDLEYDDN